MFVDETKLFFKVNNLSDHNEKVNNELAKVSNKLRTKFVCVITNATLTWEDHTKTVCNGRTILKQYVM